MDFVLRMFIFDLISIFVGNKIYQQLINSNSNEGTYLGKISNFMQVLKRSSTLEIAQI